MLIGVLVGARRIRCGSAFAGGPVARFALQRKTDTACSPMWTARPRHAGLAREDMVGRPSLAFVRDDDRAAAVESWVDMLAAGIDAAACGCGTAQTAASSGSSSRTTTGSKARVRLRRDRVRRHQRRDGQRTKHSAPGAAAAPHRRNRAAGSAARRPQRFGRVRERAVARDPAQPGDARRSARQRRRRRSRRVRRRALRARRRRRGPRSAHGAPPRFGIGGARVRGQHARTDRRVER